MSQLLDWFGWKKNFASPYHSHAEEKTKVETYLVQFLLPTPFFSRKWIAFPTKFKPIRRTCDTWLPVFEDAHDGVDDEEDEDGQVEPDELVQLPVEEADPLIKKQTLLLPASCETLRLFMGWAWDQGYKQGPTMPTKKPLMNKQ